MNGSKFYCRAQSKRAVACFFVLPETIKELRLPAASAEFLIPPQLRKQPSENCFTLGTQSCFLQWHSLDGRNFYVCSERRGSHLPLAALRFRITAWTKARRGEFAWITTAGDFLHASHCLSVNRAKCRLTEHRFFRFSHFPSFHLPIISWSTLSLTQVKNIEVFTITKL